MINKDFKYILHIFTFTIIACAQPILDVASKDRQFFMAHNTQTIDLLLLIGLLCLCLPLILIFIIKSLKSVKNSLFQTSFTLIWTFLGFLFFLNLINKIKNLPSLLHFSTALLMAILLTFLYFRSKQIKLFFTYLSPSILIIPISFLFFSPTTDLIFKKETTYPNVRIKKENAIPIHIFIFDELSIVSLLDENGEIDPIRYPNFSTFSQNAYWFKNATTVAGTTLLSIPSIVTGQYPSELKSATAENFPNNLFTLLRNSHYLHISEHLTKLCPRELNRSTKQELNLSDRFTVLISDLYAIYLHLIFPEKWSYKIPKVTQTWSNFIVNKKNLFT